jgi:hypothetical protein
MSKAAYISSVAKKPLPPAKAAAVPKMVQMIQQKKKPSGGSY